MKYPHKVKIGGVYYEANVEIGDVKTTPAKEETPKVVIEEKTTEVEEKPQYTKTEINRLSTAKLQELAKELGIDGADEMSGAQLKKIIPDKLGI